MLSWGCRLLVVERLTIHVGNLAQMARVLKIEGLIFPLTFGWYSFIHGGLFLFGAGIEKIRIEWFRMICLILIDIVKLIELETVSIDKVVDYLFEVILFWRGMIIKEVERHLIIWCYRTVIITIDFIFKLSHETSSACPRSTATASGQRSILNHCRQGKPTCVQN